MKVFRCHSFCTVPKLHSPLGIQIEEGQTEAKPFGPLKQFSVSLKQAQFPSLLFLLKVQYQRLIYGCKAGDVSIIYALRVKLSM